MADERIPIYESYHKARKLYVLFSAILSAWALVGISLTESGFKGIKIENPNALPIILFVIWIYTLFRFLIESLHNFIIQRPLHIKVEWIFVNIVGMISVVIFGLKIYKTIKN